MDTGGRVKQEHLPRATYKGKVLTEVRSPQRPLIPDTEDWERYELPFLRGIAYKARIISLLTTKASTTEEPREGILHAGICAGGAE